MCNVNLVLVYEPFHNLKKKFPRRYLCDIKLVRINYKQI